jgi:hypothetical protein
MDSVVVYACADLLVLFDEAHIFITRHVVVTLARSYLDPVSYLQIQSSSARHVRALAGVGLCRQVGERIEAALKLSGNRDHQDLPKGQ